LTHAESCASWKYPITFPEPLPELDLEDCFALIETLDPAGPDAPPDYAEIQLSQLLARWVEAGKLKVVGVNAEGQLLYEVLAQPTESKPPVVPKPPVIPKPRPRRPRRPRPASADQGVLFTPTEGASS
jgi:hypothetical protein